MLHAHYPNPILIETFYSFSSSLSNMARAIINSLNFCLLILVISSILVSPSQARPINGHHFKGISIGAVIKDSGPSPGGGNHRFINAQTLGGIKDSGPSPSTGNKVVAGMHP
ncbi:hypothetical protein Acr_05g0002390 [Actinidia rufa]|uniref:Uncharacterized protein n=1 Tax=Actinidia rufa TaxID=165716 RepID=A0A7J0EJN7_9ERIC|nr:hypothetical protein Acr_05g0002390 [Actinidia rufa]